MWRIIDKTGMTYRLLFTVSYFAFQKLQSVLYMCTILLLVSFNEGENLCRWLCLSIILSRACSLKKDLVSDLAPVTQC